MSIYDDSVTLAIDLINEFKNPHSKMTYQEYQSVPDGVGGISGMWVDQFECDVAMIPASANERMSAMQLNSEVTHHAYIVYADGTPDSSGRVIFKGIEYNVKSAINIAEANSVWKIGLKSGVVT